MIAHLWVKRQRLITPPRDASDEAGQPTHTNDVDVSSGEIFGQWPLRFPFSLLFLCGNDCRLAKPAAAFGQFH